MQNKYITIFLFLLTITLSGYAQSYLWPTNASNSMSSSFCEYREGHYHSAIDIKTWNTEGYPCYAIDDGTIKRIRLSPFGYGKVLYLQLNDGNIAVYAHLQKFTKKIDDQIRKMQFADQKYRVDWWPKDLKVKKGDILAYTGRTGIGVPHLHFEIRNSNDNPVNPLKYYQQVKDHIRPKLQKLIIVPLSTDARINDNYLARSFDIKHIKGGIYVIKEPIYIRGRVGLAVKGYDMADKVYNKYGFYKTIVENRGEPVFKIEYKELDFSTTQHIDTEIYFPFWAENRQVYHKLYIEKFNPLRFYDRTLGNDGSFIMKDEPIPFTITVEDFHRNRSVVSGELLPVKQEFKLINVSKTDNLAFLEFSSPPIKKIQFFREDSLQSWKPINYFEVVEGHIGQSEKGLVVKLDLEDSDVSRLRIEINDRIRHSIRLNGSGEQIEMSNSVDYLGKKLVLNLRGINNNWFLNQLSDLPHIIESDDLTQVVVTADWILNKHTESVGNPDKINTLFNFENFRILYPDQMTTCSWFDSTLILTSKSNALNDTTIISADFVIPDTTMKDFPVVGNVFQVWPGNFPVFRSFQISILADSLPSWGKWAIYKTNGKDKFSYLSTQIDSASLVLSARTSSLGEFIVASDTVSPEINILNPASNKIYTKMPTIKVDLGDSMSGIGDEENISLSMDGDFVLPEWDPEEKVLVGILENKLIPGKHVFTVSVRDRAGNIAREAVYFQIR